MQLPILSEAIDLVIDGDVYTRAGGFDPDPAKNLGRFVVTTAHEITLQPLFAVTPPGAHAARLLVNGVESQPFWIET